MATEAYFSQPQPNGGVSLMNTLKEPRPPMEAQSKKGVHQIPIVGHIITDNDMGLMEGSALQPINLNKVVKLLTDQHSIMLYERHLNVLQKVIKHYHMGFLMKDLVAVFKILNVCADRLEMHPIYLEPMCELLNLCGKPFFKERTSDETSFEQIAVESIAQMGYLLRVSSTKVRVQICNTIENVYCGKLPEEKVQRLKANSLKYNKRIVENSDISETLVKSMALMENDMQSKLAVLSVLQLLSKNSAKNCDMMLRAEGAFKLASRMMDPDPSGQLLFRSVDILWNFHEHGNSNEISNQLNNLSCISQIRDAFILQLTQGYSHYDRQLRNDLLVLVCLIASSHNHQSPFVETGFVRQLTSLATFQEVKSHHALVKHLKLMPNHEDFELKKLIINILLAFTKHDTASIPIMSEGKLLLALFSYVKANENDQGPQGWTPAQYEEIQLHAMDALSTFAPLMIDDYMMCQGSTRLLLLLEWCTRPGDFGGEGNSFHGDGGRLNKRSQMRYCLRLIRSMATTSEPVVLQDMVDQGAVNQMIDIAAAMLASGKGLDTAVDVEMQSDILYILSSLCDRDIHKKELFGTQGVEVVTQYLRINPSLLSGGVGHHQLMLAAVDCIWCCVVGCYLTEDFFLEKEGLFLLLDMIENCPKNMHNLVLGCMLDLCENTRALPHINTWRGKDDVTAAHMLCDLWRDEEKELGVLRLETGAIADKTRPLMGKLQHDQASKSLPASHPSRAIVDVSENMRAKLYAIFCKIGFIDLPGLTSADHVTLTIMEHYLDFKLGEVWTEVISELEEEDIQPTVSDAEALEAIQRTVVDRAEHVIQVQHELLEAQNQQDLIDEQEFYAEIRDNHRQKEKAISDFHDFVARTSYYKILTSAKERQVLSIDASRINARQRKQETYHSSEIKNLQVTTFCGRNVNIESTPARLTGGPLAQYDPLLGTLKPRNPRK